MKYIKEYKLFESSSHIFPDNQKLGGMNIDSLLNNIYIADPVSVTRDDDHTYSATYKIDGKIINITINDKWNLLVDGYPVGTKRIAYHLFKHLKEHH
jgi:hypothetical protein